MASFVLSLHYGSEPGQTLDFECNRNTVTVGNVKERAIPAINELLGVNYRAV